MDLNRKTLYSYSGFVQYLCSQVSGVENAYVMSSLEILSRD